MPLSSNYSNSIQGVAYASDFDSEVRGIKIGTTAFNNDTHSFESTSDLDQIITQIISRRAIDRGLIAINLQNQAQTIGDSLSIDILSSGVKGIDQHLAELQAQGIDLFIFVRDNENAADPLFQSGFAVHGSGYLFKQFFGLKTSAVYFNPKIIFIDVETKLAKVVSIPRTFEKTNLIPAKEESFESFIEANQSNIQEALDTLIKAELPGLLEKKGF